MHNAIGVYGYPKSGNTWLESSFTKLGQDIIPSYFQSDIHITRANKKKFIPHPLIEENGHPLIIYKSHEPFLGKNIMDDAQDLGIKSIIKVILIKRNPFDMLLSYLNFIRFIAANRAASDQPFPNSIKLYCTQELGMTGNVQEQLMTLSSLEEMQERGILESALKSFSQLDFIIPPLNNIATSWSNQILSWENQSIFDVLSVRYEDLVDFRAQEIERISRFIKIDQKLLTSAFDKQNKGAVRERTTYINEQKPTFYNKMGYGHFNDYFDQDLIHTFYKKHYDIFVSCGYKDLVKC